MEITSLQKYWKMFSSIFIAIWLLSLEFTAIPANASEGQETVRFAVIGDYGDSEQPFLGEVAAMVKSWQPDFIVTVGDNNYPDGEASTIDANVGQYFHEYIYPYVGAYGEGATENRFFPSIGNHDYTLEDSLEPYLDYFTLPGNERYYDFVQGPVHFFVLNSDSKEPDGNEDDSIQAAWLREALANSTSYWQVVVLHEAPYSSGEHGNYTDTQWPFKEWGVDAVLSGHDHHYERIIVDDLPYFVIGASGENMREIVNFIEGSQFSYNADFGALLVVASPEELHFEYYALRGKPLASETNAVLMEWLDFDISSHITGDGSYNLALVTGSNTSIYLDSRESGANAPRLLVETDEASYTFMVNQDSFIDFEDPADNFGDDSQLRLRHKYLVDFDVYLRFELADILGTIQTARLEVLVTEGEVKGGFAVFPVAETLADDFTLWTEINLNAQNAPIIQGENEAVDTYTRIHD